MVIRELIADITKNLEENPQFEARQIAMALTGYNNTSLLLNMGEKVSEDTIKAAFSMVNRRKNGEPLQYIIGSAEFMGLGFDVDKNVLIPRADTETLVETVLSQLENKSVKVLDIGTGSGCIGISIGHFNKNAHMTFLDVSAKALEIAKKNAAANGVCGEFMLMDILKEYPNKKFDVIVSNPPYIRPEVIETLQTEVKDYEPYGALYGGDVGLIFYRRITDIAPKMLTDNGILAFEIGYDQGEDVKNLMSGFSDVRVIKDLCGNDRVVTGKIKG